MWHVQDHPVSQWQDQKEHRCLTPTSPSSRIHKLSKKPLLIDCWKKLLCHCKYTVDTNTIRISLTFKTLGYFRQSRQEMPLGMKWLNSSNDAVVSHQAQHITCCLPAGSLSDHRNDPAKHTASASSQLASLLIFMHVFNSAFYPNCPHYIFLQQVL